MSAYSTQSNVLVTAFFHPAYSRSRWAASIGGVHSLSLPQFARRSSTFSQKPTLLKFSAEFALFLNVREDLAHRFGASTLCASTAPISGSVNLGHGALHCSSGFAAPF